jgi:hypothetical protein
MNGGESLRRSTETPQAVESGGAVRRLVVKGSRHSFQDFRDHELERQKILSIRILNPKIVNQTGPSITGIVMSR